MKYLRFIILLFIGVACQSENKNTTEEQNINEQNFIKLGGEPQYVEIIGESKEKPVVLFLHGGPGWPQTPQLRYFNAPEITKHCNLVIWEQRGAGQSFVKNNKPQQVSLAQIVKDGVELTKILTEKYNQSKIYLIGYSWGSVVGLNMVAQNPELFEAYIGIAQVINTRRGLKRSRVWLKEQAEKDKDQNALLKLDSLDNKLYGTEMECFLRQYEMVMNNGGALHNTAIEKDLETAFTKYDDYKDYDWMAAFEFSVQYLEEDLFSTNFDNITQLSIPVYLLLGRHDWNVASVLAAEWLNKLEAPAKEIYWLENSAHAPLEEESKHCNQHIIEILSTQL